MSETASTTSQTVTLTVELPRALVARLHALAERSEWDVATFVQEALTGYIPIQEREIALIEEALAEADSGAPGIPHEDVVAWMRSWGTPDELPPPEPPSPR